MKARGGPSKDVKPCHARGGEEGMRTMCVLRTGGWSLPGVMSD
jgi:hypothetical protein